MIRLSKLLLLSIFILFSVVSAENITIFAAASLQNVIDDMSHEFNETHPEVKIIAVYDSSSNLARQIEQGAPADLFISANESWMDYLEEKSMINMDTRIDIVKNKLALITYSDNPEIYNIKLDSKLFWKNVLKETHLAVGDPDHVPAGLYAKAAFEYWGIWDIILPHIAAAQNVRSALFLVEKKEAKFGIVYASDAKTSKNITILAQFPEESHPSVIYPMALIQPKPTLLSKKLYNFLLSKKAKTTFTNYGFIAL